MTQPPPGPPPGSDGGLPPVPAGYSQPDYPHGYAAPGQSQPQYLPPAYPPGQEPLPPRRRQRQGSPIIAPVLALIGLLLVAGASVWGISFLNATLDDAAAVEPSATPLEGETAVASDAPPDATPDPAQSTTPAAATEEPTSPPVVIEAPPGQGAEVKGTIVFTRGGDIWAASGRELRRLTDSNSTRSDSSPVWAPDGKNIYFIRTSKKETSNARPGGKYTLYPTDLMKIKADGSNKKTVYSSMIRGGGDWFSHVLQPSASVNDRSVAVVSDGPDGNGPVVLHVINAKTGRIGRVNVPSVGDLGHNNPAFSPDGTRIAFTYNDNAGTDGMPRIGVLTCQTRANCTQGKFKQLKPGYANPSWSPDGSLLAVETTRGNGRDIAIVTVRQGNVRVKLTDDGNSFAPVFSPDGDQIVYLHRDGTDIDLRVMTLETDERGKITLVDDRPVTSDGGVDGESTPSWYIPPGELTNVVPDVAASEAPDETIDPGDQDEPAATDTPAPDVDPASEGAPPPPGS